MTFTGLAGPDVDARPAMPTTALTAAAPPTPAAVSTVADQPDDGGDESATLSRVGLGVSAAALVASVAALVVALRRIAPR